MLVAIDLRVENLHLVLGGIRKYLLQGWVVFQAFLKKSRWLRRTAHQYKDNKNGKEVVFHGLPER